MELQVRNVLIKSDAPNLTHVLTLRYPDSHPNPKLTTILIMIRLFRHPQVDSRCTHFIPLDQHGEQLLQIPISHTTPPLYSGNK